MAAPPFERLYEAHRGEILAYLRRIATPGEAEDAFQETFLRALRAYDRLRSTDSLRAWLFTIATRVAIDQHRRRSATPVAGLEPSAEQARPAYAEIEHLTGDLPPTERAAVVLRFAYDLPYAVIGDALGTSEEAARQAASSGVRRIRGRMQ